MTWSINECVHKNAPEVFGETHLWGSLWGTIKCRFTFLLIFQLKMIRLYLLVLKSDSLSSESNTDNT